MSVSPGDAGVGDLLDQILLDVRRVGLSLASARNMTREDAAVAEIDQARIQIDLLVSKIQTAALSQVLTPGAEAASHIPLHARRLRRVESVFAYSRDGDWVRAADGALWAQEHEGVLYTAEGGRALARRDGRVFDDIETHAPLYCEQPAPGI